MTKIYTAGEHARIIKADPCFNDELGEKQVGLVGTVTSGLDNGGAYIKFPHYGVALCFLSNEIEPVGGTPAPEPEKEYLFREGDHVFYTGTNRDWKGVEGTLEHDVVKPNNRPVSITLTKVPESLASYGYRTGSTVILAADSVEKFTPEPDPKFKAGVWVKVVGRNDKYDGIVGQIDSKGWANFWGVTGTDGKSYQFAEDKLVPTEEPVVHKFKVGDWVKVVNYRGTWRGKVGQVTTQPTEHTRLYEVKSGDRTGLVFLESELEATTEPHWTETAPKHSAVRIDGRTVVKLSDDQWLFLYHAGDYNETVKHAVYRTGEEAKSLFYRSQPELTTPR